MKQFLASCNLPLIVRALQKFVTTLPCEASFQRDGYTHFASKLELLNQRIEEGGLDEDVIQIADHPMYSVLFGTIEVKSYHPSFPEGLNPTEWFKPTQLHFDLGLRDKRQSTHRLLVRGDNTAWFNLAACEVRHTSTN